MAGVPPWRPASPRDAPPPAVERRADRWPPAAPQHVPITENVCDEKIEVRVSEQPCGEVIEFPLKVESMKIARRAIIRAQDQLLALLGERTRAGRNTCVVQIDCDVEQETLLAHCYFSDEDIETLVITDSQLDEHFDYRKFSRAIL